MGGARGVHVHVIMLIEVSLCNVFFLQNHENSNISPCGKNIIFKKSSKKTQNPPRFYNTITNLKFQHKRKASSFKTPHIK
jgi:hypothetical protein